MHKSSIQPFHMEAAAVTGLQHNTGKKNGADEKMDLKCPHQRSDTVRMNFFIILLKEFY